MGPRLRPADRQEIAAFSGRKPEDTLLSGLRNARPCYTIAVKDDPCAMFGVVPDPTYPALGWVWLLGTPAIEDIRTTFLRQARGWLEAVGRDYQLLANFVDARNTVHIRWIKWLGFTFINRHDSFGVERRPFLEFARISPHV